jgi:hypothetical protein
MKKLMMYILNFIIKLEQHQKELKKLKAMLKFLHLTLKETNLKLLNLPHMIKNGDFFGNN